MTNGANISLEELSKIADGSYNYLEYRERQKKAKAFVSDNMRRITDKLKEKIPYSQRKRKDKIINKQQRHGRSKSLKKRGRFRL